MAQHPLLSRAQKRPSPVSPDDRASSRPERLPVNGRRDILTVKGKEPGWHYCFVTEENLPMFEAGGYEYVTHEVKIGERSVNNVAGTDGGKIKGPKDSGWLMRIKDEYHQEDVQRYNQEVNDTERAMLEQQRTEAGRYGSLEVSTVRE